MDSIRIKNLVVFANHGVFDAEKQLGQKFILDLVLHGPFQEAALEQNLKSTVHYGILADEVQEFFTAESYDLIETCAEKVAQFILRKYPIVREVDVTVKKPWAPVHLPIDMISAHVCRKRHIAYLSLGSNMGNREEMLERALDLISDDMTKILKRSSIIETKAWGLEDQPDFLNMAIKVETLLEPLALLHHVQKIENELGRVRKEHWGPRAIDVDILFYDHVRYFTDELIIPHPYIEERSFVLDPMMELAPHYIHPVLNRSMRYLQKKNQEESTR